MRVQPIILAAGKGTRMNMPGLPKVLIPLHGKPVIQYLLDTLKTTDFLPAAIVIGYEKDQVRAALGDGYTYIEQDEQLGTGHAVAVCKTALAGQADVFLIMYGDQPLWTAETMQDIVAKHLETHSEFSLVTLTSDDPVFYNFGRIIRDASGKVVAIRELRDCVAEEVTINEVNPGLYCANDAWLWPSLASLRQNNAQGEYYLTDLLGIAVTQGKPISSVEALSWREALGINTPEQLAQVEAAV